MTTLQKARAEIRGVIGSCDRHQWDDDTVIWCSSVHSIRLRDLREALIAMDIRYKALSRQAEGIARAKAEGRYKGRVPTAKRQAATVRGLLRAGKCPKEVAFEVGIGIASVYRIRQEAGIKRQTGGGR